jgi:hypothetical protein
MAPPETIKLDYVQHRPPYATAAASLQLPFRAAGQQNQERRSRGCRGDEAAAQLCEWSLTGTGNTIVGCAACNSPDDACMG